MLILRPIVSLITKRGNAGMTQLLTIADSAARSVEPLDAIVALLADRLLPRARAAACVCYAYCGRYCLPPPPFQQCGTLASYLTDCCCDDARGCQTGCCDCATIVSCC